MTVAYADIDFSIPAMRRWRKLPEGWPRAEVINGSLVVSPSPSTHHARALGRIFNALTNCIEADQPGEIFSVVDVFLTHGRNVVVPDIVFVSAKNKRAVIGKRGIYGPPDLHVEILSPKTKQRDLTIKKDLYEDAGVGEYWIVDPETKDARVIC